MNNIWITADLHFWHRNIIKYTKRPFQSVEDMNEAMITNWNSVVGPEDLIYILGDMFFCGKERAKTILDRLNGQKILIKGNHEVGSDLKWQQIGFLSVHKAAAVRLPDGTDALMSHFPYAMNKFEYFKFNLKNLWKKICGKRPIQSFSEYRLQDTGQYLLHGHVHNAWHIKKKMINVGCDSWNYFPVSLQQIITIIEGEKDGDGEENT